MSVKLSSHCDGRKETGGGLITECCEKYLNPRKIK
jgi:hypothetical protein